MKSKLNPNSPDSISLRTTVPESIVETLNLKKGDTLDWSIENREGQMLAIVKKA